MASTSTRGFTIIEVMLFLGISGGLLVALMVGVSANISQQRYRDSVTSLSGLVQQQYSEVSNTRNSRDDTWRCANSVAELDPENGQGRGTTDCVVLGRYIRTLDNGNRLELGNVIGSEPSGAVVSGGDSAALATYRPRMSAFDHTVYTPEWNARLQDTENHAGSFSVVILRSPQSGLIRTFALLGPMPADIIDMLTDDAARQVVVSCVVPDGLTVGMPLAVVIDPATAGPNGVSIRGEGNGC